MKIFRGPRRKLAIAATASAAVLATGGAALAAVLFFTSGTFSAQAAETPTLQVVAGGGLTDKLIPGQPAVGGTVNIKNPNTFPVKVTKVLVKTSGIEVTPSTCDMGTLNLHGVSGSTLNGQAGHLFDIADVTLAADETKPITVLGVVSQDAEATVLCGVKVDFVVEGAVGN